MTSRFREEAILGVKYLHHSATNLLFYLVSESENIGNSRGSGKLFMAEDGSPTPEFRTVQLLDNFSLTLVNSPNPSQSQGDLEKTFIQL